MTLKFGMLQTADKYQLKITNQKGRMRMADFIFYHNPAMNYHSLLELHAASMNVFTDLGQYNEEHGDLSGMCSNHIEMSSDAVQHYIDVAGYANNDGYLQNRLDEFVPSYLGGLDLQQRQHFCKTTTQVLRKLARDNYPTHVGSVIFFDWGTPRIYLFNNKTDTESINTATPRLHSLNQSNKDNTDEEDINSPFSTSSADSPANMQRLLQRQQQAVNNDGRDDDNDNEPEPAKPTPPSPNINDSSLQQSIHQQQQAIDDDDKNDNKKKRDRRLQRQRNRQRQSQQQSQADKQAEEARIIRERCLADEAKRDAELKHPSTRKHGSRPSVNNHAHNHKPAGPEPF